MVGWWLVLAAALVPAPRVPAAADDVAASVAGLSAPRRADRDRAAGRLEAIGDPARPALLAAVDSTDLELRARAAAVLDAIEGRALARPTPVALDFRDRPLGDILEMISDRTGLGLILEAGPDPRKAEQKVTLVAPEPVPFWEAVERLSKAAGVRVDPSPNPGWNRGMMGLPAPARPPGTRRARPYTGAEVVLVPDPGGPPPPSTRSGRFQLSVAALHHQRDRTLGGPGGRPPGSVVDRFEVRLRLAPEPGLAVGRVGDVEGLEAEDDLGQALAPAATSADPSATGGMYDNHGGRAMPAAIRLRYPDRPGAAIRRIQGALPVTVVGSKPDPVAASLVADLDKAVHRGDVSLTVHAMKLDPELPPKRVIEFSLTRPDLLGQSGGGFGGNRVANVAPGAAQGWLELVDAQGRPVERVAATPFLIGDGRRRTLRLNIAPGSPAAVEIRYLAPTWATFLVPFEFHDLPMP